MTETPKPQPNAPRPMEGMITDGRAVICPVLEVIFEASSERFQALVGSKVGIVSFSGDPTSLSKLTGHYFLRMKDGRLILIRPFFCKIHDGIASVRAFWEVAAPSSSNSV